jgi:hypothetical protein
VVLSGPHLVSKFVSFCFPAYVLMAVIWCMLLKFAMKNRFIKMGRFYLVQFHRFFLDCVTCIRCSKDTDYFCTVRALILSYLFR